MYTYLLYVPFNSADSHHSVSVFSYGIIRAKIFSNRTHSALMCPNSTQLLNPSQYKSDQRAFVSSLLGPIN